MKKFTVLLTIIVLVGFICFLAASHHGHKNRVDSYAMMEFNASYGSIYYLPTFLSIDGTGSDSDGPLFSTASTWKGYTDDGYSDTTEIHVQGVGRAFFSYPDDKEAALDVLLDTGKYFENNLVIENPGDLEDIILSILSRENIREYRYKNYDKFVAASAYAYVSCNAKGHNYETTYDFEVELPSKTYNDPHKRSVSSPNARIGAFSDNLFLEGTEPGWHRHSLDNKTVAAKVNADGFCPLNNIEHKTSSEAPTKNNAVDLFYICDFCNDAGCSICNDYRDQDHNH